LIVELENKNGPKPPEDPKKPSTTGHVLRVVYGSNQAEVHQPHSPHESEEDDKVEVDERWLMTYADKMTLLCGLFIMLFAMSTMDPASQKEIIESTKKTFGESAEEKEEKVKETQTVQELQKIKQEKIELETKIQVLETKLVQVEQKPPPIDQIKQLQEEKEQLEKQLNIIPDLRLQIMKIEQEKVDLKQQLEEKPKPTPPPKIVKEKPTPRPVDPKELLKPVQERLEITEERLAQTRMTLATVEQKLETSEAKVEELQRIVNKSATSAASSMFLAFMVKWPTNDHDVDLTVEDPSGRKFDFKNRKISGHPGTFVLDTRRGPGIEVWQADKIIPGIYKFTYTLYNAYGNKAPCPISGTIFSSKGSVEIPATTLDTESRRTSSVRVQIDEDGKAVIR